MDVLRSVRARRTSPRGVAGPAALGAALSWIGDERIAISAVPSARTVACLAEQGVTHIVNCRPRVQVRWSGDLAAGRAACGPGRVAHAPVQGHGRGLLRRRVLDAQPQAGVLIHCAAGRRRSAPGA